MVRLNVTKQQKSSRKRGTAMAMSSQLSGITHFSDITALTGGDQVGALGLGRESLQHVAM